MLSTTQRFHPEVVDPESETNGYLNFLPLPLSPWVTKMDLILKSNHPSCVVRLPRKLLLNVVFHGSWSSIHPFIPEKALTKRIYSHSQFRPSFATPPAPPPHLRKSWLVHLLLPVFTAGWWTACSDISRIIHSFVSTAHRSPPEDGNEICLGISENWQIIHFMRHQEQRKAPKEQSFSFLFIICTRSDNPFTELLVVTGNEIEQWQYLFYNSSASALFGTAKLRC